MAESVWLRGEGGGVWEMSLPLHEGIGERVEKGLIVRVNPDGSPWVAPAEPVAPAVVVAAPEPVVEPAVSTLGALPSRPKQSDSRAAWQGYCVRVLGMDAEESEGATKGDLMEFAARRKVGA